MFINESSVIEITTDTQQLNINTLLKLSVGVGSYYGSGSEVRSGLPV